MDDDKHTVCLLLVIFVLYACSGRRVDNVIIKGSDTEVNLVLELAEAYMAKDSAISLAITGGGLPSADQQRGGQRKPAPK